MQQGCYRLPFCSLYDFRELGIIEEMLDKLIAKLGANLDSVNIPIKRHTLRGLQVVGTGRTDVLRLILPKLIDEEVC